jgi:hypothetical protein
MILYQTPPRHFCTYIPLWLYYRHVVSPYWEEILLLLLVLSRPNWKKRESLAKLKFFKYAETSIKKIPIEPLWPVGQMYVGPRVETIFGVEKGIALLEWSTNTPANRERRNKSGWNISWLKIEIIQLSKRKHIPFNFQGWQASQANLKVYSEKRSQRKISVGLKD